MTSEAIVIGVNHYEFLQSLSCARQDAWAMKTFLEQEAGFDRVYYFAEDAPAVNGVSMKPTRNNLRWVMRDTFAKPFMGDGDNFWFFFSGHGMRDGERDFLMPIDGDPDDVAESGISTAQVSEWLRGCGADNVVMMLDACRNGGRKDGKGIGDETREGCRQTGVISLFSCSPNQFSYELPDDGQGAFTKVLLEGLGVQGACATVARLDEYLKRRVPEVVRDYWGERVNQVPYSIAEPINKSHLILMPQHSRPEDLNALKMDAFRAEKAGNFRLALQCWLRVNIASRGLDPEALDEIFELKIKLRQAATTPVKSSSTPVTEVPLPKGDLGGSKPEPPSSSQSVPKPPAPQPPAPKAPAAKPPAPKPTTPKPPAQPPLDAIPLDSEKGVDYYRKLRDLLEAGQWRAADQETLQVMLKAANRVSDGWLDAASLKNFPCKDLKTIDQLWVTASKGHFGFSVQKKIWEDCGSPTSSGKNWDQFCVRVGWQNKQATVYVNYSDLKNNPSLSPKGELPVKGVWVGLVGGKSLFSRKDL